jgi:hypothetical protein
MKKFVAASLFLLLTVCLTGNALAGIVFDISESGPNLVVTATGSLDLTGFTNTQTNGAWNSGLTYIRPATVTAGSGSFDSYTTGTTFFTSGGALTTQVFPSGPAYLSASTSSGDYVAFQLSGTPPVNPLIYVPTGYTSNAPINGTATYSGLSLASLGMTPSTVWKWYLGADGDESQSITIVPEPSTYVIAFAGVAGASVLCGRRKKST